MLWLTDPSLGLSLENTCFTTKNCVNQQSFIEFQSRRWKCLDIQHLQKICRDAKRIFPRCIRREDMRCDMDENLRSSAEEVLSSTAVDWTCSSPVVLLFLRSMCYKWQSFLIYYWDKCCGTRVFHACRLKLTQYREIKMGLTNSTKLVVFLCKPWHLECWTHY